jgi:hypothetical protein
MRTFVVFLLLAVAACNTDIEEPILEIDVEGLIKCISEVVPLVPDVIEIINHIKAADWAQVAIKAAELVSKGIPAVKECIAAFKKVVNLKSPSFPLNNQCVVTCTLTYYGRARLVCSERC